MRATHPAGSLVVKPTTVSLPFNTHNYSTISLQMHVNLVDISVEMLSDSWYYHHILTGGLYYGGKDDCSTEKRPAR
jgi:hypothetical protein